jgi:hypothetical protein
MLTDNGDRTVFARRKRERLEPERLGPCRSWRKNNERVQEKKKGMAEQSVQHAKGCSGQPKPPDVGLKESNVSAELTIGLRRNPIRTRALNSVRHCEQLFDYTHIIFYFLMFVVFHTHQHHRPQSRAEVSVRTHSGRPRGRHVVVSVGTHTRVFSPYGMI